MYNHIKGILVEKAPTHAVIEANGVGFFLNISLSTFSQLPTEGAECKLFCYLAIREDAHTLYGFAEDFEREVFKLLISVSGVGASTARMILSSLSASELTEEIAAENARALQAVKGVGAKSAQRIIIDLKDKVPTNVKNNHVKIETSNNTVQDEALSALTLLGFDKKKAEKVIEMIMLNSNTDLKVEELIKLSLKKL
ncbi:MAG: Holliday junction branch migration protein RuvA [Luteibaculaceae bacterium]